MSPVLAKILEFILEKYFCAGDVYSYIAILLNAIRYISVSIEDIFLDADEIFLYDGAIY